jgi:hypothetical protein
VALVDVLEGRSRWHVEAGDCLDFLAGLPAGSCDLVFGSPPYTGARSYLEDGEDLGIAREAEAWAAWMVEVTLASLRVCKGLVAWVVEGQTEDYRWDAAPLLLGADLARRGVCLRRPCYYRRVGIPGSGGPDWFRCDAEPILCCTNGGRLPWAESTACGHPPRWAPGGAMSHRLTDGQRKNGAADPWMKRGRGNNIGGVNKDGSRKKGTKAHTKARRRPAAGDVRERQDYAPPVLANPGTVVEETYTAREVEVLLGLHTGEFVDCVVGGNQMGSRLAHENEAPFPETLPERFVRSFCPSGGLVLDPFTGSGTTLAVAVRCGRRALGCDLRPSQVELTRRRLAGVAPGLFEGLPS